MTTSFETDPKSENQAAVSVPISKVLMIVALSAVFFGIAVWMVVPAPPSGFSWDDAWYLLMAEWLTPESNFRVLAWTMLWVTSYPPLFPLLIAWSGAGLADQQSAFILNALFLALGSGVAMFWFAREGFSSLTITLAAMLLVFNPVTLGYLPILFSEFLFSFLFMITLALACSRQDWKWNSKWVVIGIIIGLSVATRSAGWALVAGVLLHLVFNRKLLPMAAFIAGLAVGILAIPFLMVGLPPPAVNYMDQLLGNLGNLGWDFLVQQIKGLLLGWSMLWGWGAGPWLAAIAVLPGFFIRLKSNRIDAWIVVMYLGMLLVWPWPGHMGRFLWPLLPCFLVSVHSSFGFLKNSKYRTIMASVLMGLIVLLSVPDGIGRSLERLLDTPKGELFLLSRMHEWTRSGTREEGISKLKERQQMLQDLKRVAELVDPKACIYSEMSPLVSVRTLKVAYPSLWNSLDKAGLTKIRCEYYYMLPDSISGANLDSVNRFANAHEELFRSYSSNETEDELPLGVFLRFRPLNAE